MLNPEHALQIPPEVAANPIVIQHNSKVKSCCEWTVVFKDESVVGAHVSPRCTAALCSIYSSLFSAFNTHRWRLSPPPEPQHKGNSRGGANHRDGGLGRMTCRRYNMLHRGGAIIQRAEVFRGPFSQPGQKLGFQESDVGVGDTVPPAVNPLAVRVTSRCQALVISKETNNNKQGLGTGQNGDT